MGVCEVTPRPPGTSGDAGPVCAGSTVLMGLWDGSAVSVEAVISMALDAPLSRVDNKNTTFFVCLCVCLRHIVLSTEDKV